ncbi:SoxR reducing system RseC family protein [Candidatus Erwinia haradaeae]|uniref:Protein RseC, partial n=1 Tax=Candidatus Erwinia haradaeae TaxID=1922217 RepID=A0A451D4S0_9GAMM|nr:SoxR reducing system RseC family protein [Candidatus Erwinia haradaeae]VFP80731.1 Protein RseC [Candidatus Erwinia haradaeae]
MIKVIATVASYQNNILTLHVQKNIVCKNCSLSLNLLESILHSNNTENMHKIIVCDKQKFLNDQQVELSISKNTVLITAFFIYMTPLLGLFTAGGIFQRFFCNDKVTMLAALLGGTIGIFFIKTISKILMRLELFQLKILK